MEIVGNVLNILDADMEVPEMFGPFHLFFFVASVVVGFVLSSRHPQADGAYVRRLLIGSSVLVILLEVYKQINFSFSYDGNQISFDYQWYAFPFQFCSTPMYVGLLAGLTKNSKMHQGLCAYLATFSVFAGLCVMVYPPQVFVSTIGINIQTMVCHGCMLTIGIYLLRTGYVPARHKTILKAIPVFFVAVSLAMGMNEIAYRSGLLERETFNMFLISPYCEPSLPVYSLVQAVVPFPWCTIIYIGVFSLAAYLILLTAMLVKRAAHHEGVIFRAAST